jgi:hypothetical protein
MPEPENSQIKAAGPDQLVCPGVKTYIGRYSTLLEHSHVTLAIIPMLSHEANCPTGFLQKLDYLKSALRTPLAVILRHLRMTNQRSFNAHRISARSN